MSGDRAPALVSSQSDLIPYFVSDASPGKKTFFCEIISERQRRICRFVLLHESSQHVFCFQKRSCTANLCIVDPSSKKGYQERFIHSEIYKKFPNINSVVHSHSDAVLPYTMSGVPMKPTFHIAGFLGIDY